MGWGEVASAEMHSKALEKYRSRMTEEDGKPAFKGAAGEADRLIKRRPMVLDMGEASREQGFRLNGCR